MLEPDSFRNRWISKGTLLPLTAAAHEGGALDFSWLCPDGDEPVVIPLEYLQPFLDEVSNLLNARAPVNAAGSLPEL